MENDLEKVSAEELGFQIHPRCKICNSPYKLEIDKMLMEGVVNSRVVDFCLVINPRDNRQRVAGSPETILRGLQRHKKNHITIDDNRIEEAQRKSLILYKAKVQEKVSLGMAKQIATQRMVDELSDDRNEFTLQDLAVPINLEQRERSVKVEEGALQINFAKFIKSNENEQISGNEVKSIENSIRELNERISDIGEEIRGIEGPKEKVGG